MFSSRQDLRRVPGPRHSRLREDQDPTPTAWRRRSHAMDSLKSGMIFVNLVDFDQLYGHRNDVEGYARALEEVDDWLPSLEAQPGSRRPADPDRRSRLRPDDAVHRSQPRVRPAAGLRQARARGRRSRHPEDAIRYRPDGGGEFRDEDRDGRELLVGRFAASASASACAAWAGAASGWHLPLHTVSETFCRSPSRFGSDTEGRRTLTVSTTEPSGFVRRCTTCCSLTRMRPAAVLDVSGHGLREHVGLGHLVSPSGCLVVVDSLWRCEL